jgi:hypothetical protein
MKILDEPQPGRLLQLTNVRGGEAVSPADRRDHPPEAGDELTPGLLVTFPGRTDQGCHRRRLDAGSREPDGETGLCLASYVAARQSLDAFVLGQFTGVPANSHNSGYCPIFEGQSSSILMIVGRDRKDKDVVCTQFLVTTHRVRRTQ